MQLKELEGTVEAVNNRKTNDWFGLMINDEWYNGDNEDLNGELKVQKNDKVQLLLDNEDSVQGVKILSSGDSNTTNGRGTAQQRVKGKGDSTRPQTNRQNSINFGMAFNKAVDQCHRNEFQTEEDYKDGVKNLIDLHLEIIEEKKSELNIQ